MVPHFSVLSLPASSNLHLQKQHQIDISCDHKLLQHFFMHRHNNNFSNSSIISNIDTGNYRTNDDFLPRINHIPTDSVEMYGDINLPAPPMPYIPASSNPNGSRAPSHIFQNDQQQRWSNAPPPQNWNYDYDHRSRPLGIPGTLPHSSVVAPPQRIPQKRPVVRVNTVPPTPPPKKLRTQHNDGKPIGRTAIIPVETSITRREQLAVYQASSKGHLESHKWKFTEDSTGKTVRTFSIVPINRSWKPSDKTSSSATASRALIAPGKPRKVFSNDFFHSEWVSYKALIESLEISIDGQSFTSGIHLYQNDFPEDSCSGILDLKFFSKNLILLPHFDTLYKHIHFWLGLCSKLSRSVFIIAPVRESCNIWRAFHNLDVSVTIFLRNKLQSIKSNPPQTCIFLLNASGPDLHVDNSITGNFILPSVWMDKINLQPLSNLSELPSWSEVRDKISLFKSQEAQDFIDLQSPFKFDDLIFATQPGTWVQGFNPLSPQWQVQSSPLLRLFHPHWNSVTSRNKLSLKQTEYLLEQHKGNFRPQGSSFCLLCHSNTHATQSCWMRIPSAQELGIHRRIDLALHSFLSNTQNLFQPLQQQDILMHKDVKGFIENELKRREQSFIASFTLFCSNLTPPLHINWLEDWVRPGFGQLCNDIAGHIALGKMQVVLFWIAFGLKLPFHRTPPSTQVGGIPSIDSEEHWECWQKKLSRGTAFRSPNDFPKFISPPFALFSSDKVRDIQNFRYLNGFIIDIPFSLETLDDFLFQLEHGDFIWYSDLKSCYEQFLVCPSDQRFLGTQFYHKGELFTACATHPAFGINVVPFFCKLISAEETRIVSFVVKANGRFFDDFFEAESSHISAPDLKKNMIFINWLRADFLGWIYGATKCVKNPTQFIRLLGFNVNTRAGYAFPPSDKIQQIFDLCHEILNTPKTSLSDLSRIAGKMLTYGPKFAKIFLSELFQLISNHTIILLLKQLDVRLKGAMHKQNAYVSPISFNISSTDLTHLNSKDSKTQKLYKQLSFNRKIQDLSPPDLVLTFKSRKLFTSPEVSSELYHIPFPTPVELDRIFRGWFSCLEHFSHIMSHTNIYATFTKAFFITSDASDLGVGFHILSLTKNQPSKTTILGQSFIPFPDILKSFIISNSDKLVHDSGIREMFGLFSALKLLITLPTEPLPVILFSDNLETVLSFSSFKNKNSLALFYLKSSLDLLHKDNIPYEAIWKPRTVISARSSDLASRLSNWNLNSEGLNLAFSFFNISPQTIFHVPWTPIQLIQWTSITVPPNINLFHNTEKFIIILLPPNFPKFQYQCIFKNISRFNFNGLLVCPLFKNTSWFNSHFSTKPHLELPFTADFFKTSYLSDNVFKFNAGIFSL